MVLSRHEPQTVEIAGFVRRSVAALLDAVPALTLWWVVTLNLSSSTEGALPPSRWNLLDHVVDLLNAAPHMILWPLAWFSVASVVWHTLSVTFFGTSPGKRIVGLKLIDRQGEGPGPLRALIHALLALATSFFLALGG